MTPDMLAELAHVFYTEACPLIENPQIEHTERDRQSYLKCSRALAERAVKEGKREDSRLQVPGSR